MPKEQTIFEFIKAGDNDIISKMTGLNLQALIVLIDKFYLQLRSNLGIEKIEKNVTFGVEKSLFNNPKKNNTRKYT